MRILTLAEARRRGGNAPAAKPLKSFPRFARRNAGYGLERLRRGTASLRLCASASVKNSASPHLRANQTRQNAA